MQEQQNIYAQQQMMLQNSPPVVEEPPFNTTTTATTNSSSKTEPAPLNLTTEQQVSETNDDVTVAGTSDQLRRRSKYDPKQVTVQSVHPDGTVECQLLCKQKTINFKFNRFDTQPSDIIEGMLSEDCLNSVSQKTLTEQLNDIIKQLQENPSKIPECWRYVQKVCFVSVIQICPFFF